MQKYVVITFPHLFGDSVGKMGDTVQKYLGKPRFFGFFYHSSDENQQAKRERTMKIRGEPSGDGQTK